MFTIAAPSPERFSLSFEFFPPHTPEGLEKLKITARTLAMLYPAYFSVTFGVAGNVQDYTLSTVLELHRSNFRIPIAPHISCIGTTPDSIRQLLNHYNQVGINQLVVLRGDVPSGMVKPGYFKYAIDLVKFIREESGDYFFIDVAAYPEYHPEAIDPDSDFKYFSNKVNAGANRAITQYFFNTDSYWYFVERCQRQGIKIPVIPGIMPINNFYQLQRFSDSCCAEIPRWLRLRLAKYADDTESLCAFGNEFVTNLCQRLLDQGAPGLHFYTLNKAESTLSICQKLKWV
jgi:methylenetetrahydrofolate reductase (NADPH)